jgi:hypothetical protein
VRDDRDVLLSGSGVVASVSLEALHYGQEICRFGCLNIASRLYQYNSAPLSPAVCRALPTSQALDEFLGLSGSECLGPLVREHWVQVTRWWESGPWCSWASRVVSDPADLDPLLYKLYISPRWEYIGTAIRRCLPILAEIGAPVFKWGRELIGILRPDKFVVYFRSRESLHQAADRLLTALRGVPAQGVPFTAELGGDGLLSWAKDPLPVGNVTGTRDRQSWRQWVCGCLAESLAATCPVAVDGVEPWERALDRIRHNGVDPRSWTWRDAK